MFSAHERIGEDGLIVLFQAFTILLMFILKADTNVKIARLHRAIEKMSKIPPLG